jgi:hypothetical protein
VHWDNWKYAGYVHVVAGAPGAETYGKKESLTRREKERIKITREKNNEQGKQE